MDKPNKVVIDADVLAFKSSAAIEKRWVDVIHTPTGDRKRFSSRDEFHGHWKKKAGGWLGNINKSRVEMGKEPFLIEEFEYEDGRDVEPKEHAFQICKTMIENIMKACGAKEYVLAIERESSNFRDDVATICKYKDREDMLRPLYLYEVKDYMIGRHPHIIADNMEADDVLAILSATGEAIQCTNDKDSRQVYGWSYDFDKSEKPFEIKNSVGKIWTDKSGKLRAMGFKSLCLQLLTGDTTDTILPRKLCGIKYGEKKAEQLLSPLRSKKACAKAVIDLYKEWYALPTVYSHWKTGAEMTATWDSVLLEMGKLLYMLRSWEDEGFTIERFEKGEL